MDELKLFTDASVNPRSGRGVGAYLIISGDEVDLEQVKSQIKTRLFSDTNSTRLELQTLIWALNDIGYSTGKIIIYTDCQNLLGLPSRRDRMERKAYQSRNGRQLNLAELYQQFFHYCDHVECEFFKVVGHKPSYQKVKNDRIFALVDKASRRALRNCKL